MKVGKLFTLLLVVLIIAFFGFFVVNGLYFGAVSVQPMNTMKLGLDLTGGVYIVYEAADSTVADLDNKINGAMEIFRTRLDDKGFTEATITRQGSTRIRVEIPINETSAIKDPTDIVDFIGKPAKLQFLNPDGSVIVEGSDIQSARAMVDENGEYMVEVVMTNTVSEKFAQATKVLYESGEALTIALDGSTISTATIQNIITGGKGFITGDFTQEDAQNLAMQIESGALPLELKALENRSITATLGDEALQKGIYAGIVGFIILLIFMLVVYRVPGIAANIALVAYVSIVIFLLSAFEIQLTLPGIAGIILGIGMAVDANVIIFARFNEEYYAGKSMRAALKSGFSKATKAITDANVTTIIAAVVLGVFGTGAIKGFAYTLGISIIVSLFSALVITQNLLKLFLSMFPNGVAMYLSPMTRSSKASKANGGSN